MRGELKIELPHSHPDGEPEAIAEIKRGGPYKASINLASPVYGYAMGQHGADRLEGKASRRRWYSCKAAYPRQSDLEADLADPAAVYRDAKRAAYLKMYGNICYDTRDQHQFPLVVGAAGEPIEIGPLPVIASEAKQSMVLPAEAWIASSLMLLAMTAKSKCRRQPEINR